MQGAIVMEDPEESAAPAAIGVALRDMFAHAASEPLPDRFLDLLAELNAADTEECEQRFRDELIAVRPRLRSYARSLTRNSDEAEDLLQEALLKAWAARSSFAQGTNMGAWMRTILRNHFFSQRRRARFQAEYDEAAAEQQLAQPPTQGASLELQELARALDRLPETQREAVLLAGLDALDYEEVAQRTATSLGTVKSRISRGRAALQIMLEQGIPPEPEPQPQPSTAQAASNRAEGQPQERKSAAGRWAAAKAAGRPLWIG